MSLGDWLQYIGAATGILGALLIALNISVSRFGYVSYLVSNVAWLAYAWMNSVHGLLAMQGVFFLTTLIGLWSWFPAMRKKHVQSTEPPVAASVDPLERSPAVFRRLGML